MKSFYERISALIIALGLLLSPVSAKDISVNYRLSDYAESGIVRYVSQIPKNEYYYEEYWGKYASYSSHECGTACISMALSYLGIDETPEELGDYWIEQGYTEGEPFSTVFYDVPGASGGHSFDFEAAYSRYEEGGYSPVIIYFTRELNPYRSGNRHFVMVVDKTGENEYIAIDPASDDIRTVTIEKNESGSLTVGTEAKDGTFLSGEMTEEELCSAQYRLSDTPYVKSEAKKEEPTEEIKEEKEAEAEAVKPAEPAKEKKEPETVTAKEEKAAYDGVSKKPYNRAARLLTAAIKKSIAE